MKTIIKGDEENKQTMITFILDWNEPSFMEKLNTLISNVCLEKKGE